MNTYPLYLFADDADEADGTTLPQDDTLEEGVLPEDEDAPGDKIYEEPNDLPEGEELEE